MQTGIFMMGFGEKTRLMASESTVIWMALSMRENGKKISNMERELRHGQMEPAMKETMWKARSTAMESSHGLMDQHMKGSSLTTTSMEKVSRIIISTSTLSYLILIGVY